ncbi:hypothetical protein HOLleu_02114 [Holothuria leucospilota]|uniref:Uncharacterized protein n=1 Tax=Holothuria leucospilota TaxID=206669 RepID=A0A9Q1CRX2_HOLLE|nr:hypothetical protein HOLleu_02114 [Holothuria leucospilota]
MREKPNALTIALEGMIMCAKNEMSEWRDRLDDVKRSEYMEYARKSVREQRREFHERRERIREFKVCKWNERREKAAEREVNERVKKLTEQLVSDGGLWKCESEMNERLNGKSESEQMSTGLSRVALANFSTPLPQMTDSERSEMDNDMETVAVGWQA